ncbi:ABC-2 type transporter-domain-containing protein [Fusarium solani]|uniref:ABC-2 type transporter-domain-containing protein n=1 Tax=Fusarium solani TaxID=169388 RepID=A0A9P9KZ39_FUSSL|nr:ABC-2 type transporter-domain-containing protein [Fusarium solani]KAH7270978.1 ABC-2 type transporter-domain-containing protein [Fusarium solani]
MAQSQLQEDDAIQSVSSNTGRPEVEEFPQRHDSESSGNGQSTSSNDGSGRNGSFPPDEVGHHKHPARPRLHKRQTTHVALDTADRNELVRIATALSRRYSIATGEPSRVHTLVTEDENVPALDPTSSQFDIYEWLQNFVQTLRNQGITAKKTGVVWKNLNVSGTGAALQVQETVASMLMAPLRLGELFSFGKKEPKHILRSFDGLVKSGELLIVLGRPGSGCSTLLKTLCGELHGLSIAETSTIHYNGIPQKVMKKEFKGEAIYNQEVDRHFPHLTVGQTLEFAASVRTPSHRIHGMSRNDFCKYISRVVMATYGLSHAADTKVGNDFIRGVSGGERKRVSIAEMILSGSPFSAWDNSTRGLDSATALKFVQALRMAADLGGVTTAVAIYQASQAIYDLFDKAVVLYEGRQIYFGPANEARSFFERQGWHCPARQTTGDFLTSVTNPSERTALPGMEERVPRTPEEFEDYWKQSPEFQTLQKEIEEYETDHLVDRPGESIATLREQKHFRQSKHVRPGSPYTISILMQVRLCTKRAYQRIWNDISATATACVTQLVMALIIGSIFYGTPDATVGFYAKGSVLFMAVLLNALTAISEIASLYAQREIVTKHASFAFYHPFAEGAAGIAAAIPIKFVTAVFFNIVLYFLAGLRREPGNFFLYFLITYICTFVFIAFFRTMAAISKTVSQAMALSGVMVLALVVYVGFTITVPEMKPWFSWIRWINPIYYAFEILVANEFHGQQFTCSSIFPPYTPNIGDSWICTVPGAVAGEWTVSGDAFIAANYEYYYSNVWRNLGILFAFLIGFTVIYLVATELNSASTSTAEALVFQKGHIPPHLQAGKSESSKDEESLQRPAGKETSSSGDVGAIEPQKDIFTWRNVVYDIQVKDGQRRLLDGVSGWVKPGTLTALMGVSGAGKTTLLDVLAQRTTMGVITGDMLVNGRPFDASFQRKTGYVQQQDLHLQTATVRESLRFSAMLRQPKSVSKQEKYAFVEEVIKMLNMQEYADAIVGVPGEGLNVEQRKLLTIGVELAAKPKLLLFLDEPTSGLDSQSSWAICSFLRKLANSGQAVLCTVHQPSAILFQQFDRLLFLAKGGKTVYFGNIGEDSRTLLDYFQQHGARTCDKEENPAEYILEVISNVTNNKGEDWHSVWKGSEEHQAVETEIDRIHAEKQNEAAAGEDEASSHAEFAMPFFSQLQAVSYRVFQQYWRMPAYIFAKFMLGIVAGLFIGFSFFQESTSQAGMQNVIFSVFLLTTIFTTLVQQIIPNFVTQRSLYEVRERPSKAYSWKAFIIANIIVEIPYQIVTGILIWSCFYYPVVGIQSSDRQVLVLLFVIELFIYASAFAQMTIAALPDAQTAGSLVTILTMMSTIFSGVLQTPSALPGFWIFMYRLSPFTYWISGIVATMLHGRPVECSSTETSTFNPPSGETCGEYLNPILSQVPGELQNPSATEQCRYCAFRYADQYLAGSRIYWSERWRNYGIMWAFIGFNMMVAIVTYYLFRVKKWSKK